LAHAEKTAIRRLRYQIMANLYVDLTDAVVNSIYHGASTGMQRVQINVAFCLRKSLSSQAFSIFEGRFESLDQMVAESQGDADAFVRLAREKYKAAVERYARQQRSPLISLPARCFHRAARLYRDLRVKSTLKFGRGDALFTMGAFWQYPPLVDFYRQKTKEGVELIGILHDLTWISYPEYIDRKLFQKFLALPIHLITISNFTRSELERAVRENILTCNYKTLASIALAHEFVGARRNDVSTYSVTEANKRYALYVSSLDHHKNHSAIISAWKQLHEEFGDKLPHLILVGKKASAASEILRPGNLGDAISFCERPSDEKLKMLYTNCVFTVFPSYREGWGLPIGESLWFGKACAASNRTSIPEAGGDLCVYFDPSDMEDIKTAILSLLDQNVRLDYEKKIRSAALRSWNQVSEDIEMIVTSIINEAPRSAQKTG
jgi:glycosyltransferase involved in cell wall biosynthesis